MVYMKNYCSNCGNQIKEKAANFCPKCGKSLGSLNKSILENEEYEVDEENEISEKIKIDHLKGKIKVTANLGSEKNGIKFGDLMKNPDLVSDTKSFSRRPSEEKSGRDLLKQIELECSTSLNKSSEIE